jgi:hypothetical protein
MLVALLLVAAGATSARAKAHYAKKEALDLVFAGADRIETKTFFLTDEEKTRIEELGKAPLESKLITVHVGEKDGAPMGYGFIDTQLVRTLPETMLVVVGPDGSVAKLLLLAFYEPPEYEASERWLEQFPGKTLGPDLRVDRDIHGIAGSTLTSHAVTTAVRRSLALFQVLIQKK